MRQRFICRVTAVLFAAALGVSAGGAAEERALPEGVAVHVSIADPMAFLRSAFEYADAATTSTAYYVPGDVAGMLAMAYSPMPFDAWDAGSELHVALFGEENTPEMAVLFRVESFDQLLEGLGNADWEIGEAAAAEEPFATVRPVVAPNGRDMFLADPDDGRAVLADTPEAARRIAEWNPEHGAGADLIARMRFDGPLGGMMDDLSGALVDRVADEADGIVDAVAEAGLTEEAGQRLAATAEKYVRVVGDEVEQVEEISLELSFVDGRLVAGLSVLSAGGSWTRKFAETVEEEADGDFPDGTLLKRLPEGYFSAGVTASVTESAPDLEALNEAVLADIAEIAPERKDALLAHGKALFAAGPGATASANYLDNGVPYQIALCEYDDAQAAIDAMIGAGDAFNSIAEKAFADPAKSVSFPFEKQSDGDLRWYAWRIESASARSEGFGEFLSRLDSAAPGGMMTAGTVLDPDFRIYAARLEDPEALLIVTGALGQDEFAAILQSVAESAGDAETPFDNPEVQTTAEALGAAQFSLGLMKPEDLYLYFTMQYAAQEGMPLPPGLFDEVERSAGADADVLLGGGAEDGRVALRMALPAAAVNAAARMHESVGGAMMMMEAENARRLEQEQEQSEGETKTEE